MRLIDADALLEKIDTERDILVKDGRLGTEHVVVRYVRNFIEDAPTVDAVEVIRCAECKRAGTWFGRTMKCKRWNQLVDMSFYCGDGELVEDE